MIQYYLDLENQVKVIQAQHLEQGAIQKIYSTAYFISLSIRVPGKTKFLYLGRGGGFEGVWIHSAPPPSELRKKDNFLEYLRRHLISCIFQSVELDPNDRILKLNYQKFGQLQSIAFFWKARKLFFLHYYKDAPEAPFKLLLSWRGRAIIPNEEMLDLFDYFNEVGRRVGMDHSMRSPRLIQVPDLLQLEIQSANLKSSGNASNSLQRKVQKIEADLQKNQQWKKIQEVLDRGDDLKDHYQIEIGDHKIKFQGDLNAYERRNLLFEKIKKLKRGESIMNQRLHETQELLSSKGIEEKKDSGLSVIRPVWGRDELAPNTKISQQIKDEFKVYKFDNFSIGVGLNSFGNDQLRNKWASKEDVWVHLDGLKSSHGVIKLNQTILDANHLNLAASIVAYFSHFKSDWIPIIYTQVKNLKGVTGSPGMVIYKKEKHLQCPYIAENLWFKEES